MLQYLDHLYVQVVDNIPASAKVQLKTQQGVNNVAELAELTTSGTQCTTCATSGIQCC